MMKNFSLVPKRNSILVKYSIILFILLFSFMKETAAQCNNDSGGACGNLSGTNLGTIIPGTSWQSATIQNGNRNYYEFNGTAGITYGFRTCVNNDMELTIQRTGNNDRRTYDQDNFSCASNGRNEFALYTVNTTAIHNVRYSRHGNCSNTNSSGTLEYRAYMPCSGITPSYGSNSWNSYVYDGKDLNTLFGFIGNQAGWDNLNYNWGSGQPINSGCGEMCDNDNYSTRHMMNRNFTRAFYNINYSSDDGIRISFDGGTTWYLNLWNDNTNTGSFTVFLDGNTNVIVDQRENTGNASISVSFCQMSGNYTFGNNIWNYYVFDDKNVEFNKYQGTNSISDLNFNLNWGSGQPSYNGTRCGRTMDDNNFSVRFMRNHNFANGNYSIRMVTDDGVRVSTNGGSSWNVYNVFDDNTKDVIIDNISLSGSTNLMFDMRENSGGARASFNIVKVPSDVSSINTNLPGNTICTSGGSITLNAIGAEGTVYWYSGSCGGTFLGTGDSITVSPAGNTTYFARNRNFSDAGGGNTLEKFSNNCASINVIVGTALTNVSAGADIAICKGQNTQLSGSVTASGMPTSGAATFSYSGSGWDCNNFNVGGTTSGIPTGATITSIVWNASMNVPCSWSEMDLYINNVYIGWTCGASNITYNGLNGQPANGQSIRLRSWDNDFYCDLMTMNLSFTVNYTYLAPAAVNYSWWPVTGLNNANIANPIASPTATTTYTMTATSNGCSVSEDVTVTVNNYGTDGILTASTSTGVCINNPIAVAATSGNGNPRYWIQNPAGTASWNIAENQASNSVLNGYTYTPTSTGTYRVHARWQNGCGFCWDEAGHNWNSNNKCPNFAAIDFNVVAQPTAPTNAVKIPNTASVCEGSTLTINGAASGGEAGVSCLIEYQYSVNNGVNWISTGTSIPSFTAVTGTNIIQARRAGCQSGCGTTSWNTIASWTVTANPVASISGTNAVCVGNNSTFTASGGATYFWNTGATTANITVADANMYTVTVTNANGCTSSANRTLTINQPNTNISVNGVSISNGDYLWNGNKNAVWDLVDNWYVFNGSNYTLASLLPTSSTNVFIVSSSGQCTGNINNIAIPSSTPAQSVKDINLGVGSQVVLAGSNNNFVVTGNWNNAGTFNATSGTVIFNGNQDQEFNCNGGSLLHDVVIQNTALNGKVNINSNLNSSGIITVNQGELVVPATRIIKSNKVNMGSNGKLLLGGEMRVNE